MRPSGFKVGPSVLGRDRKYTERRTGRRPLRMEADGSDRSTSRGMSATACKHQVPGGGDGADSPSASGRTKVAVSLRVAVSALLC